MARKMESKEVDGVHYTVTQYPVKKSLRILSKLSKHIGPSLGTMLANFKDTKTLMNQDLSKLDMGDAISSLTDKLNDDTLYDLLKDICETCIAKAWKSDSGNVTIPGGQLKGENFDEHFSDDQGLKRMFMVAKFALEVNYGSFLGALVGGRSLEAVEDLPESTSAKSTG